MANRGQKIAGPLVSRKDSKGKPDPATHEEVGRAFIGGKVHPAVIAEWENEARRRNGHTSLEAIRGHEFRDIRKARREAIWYHQDRKDGADVNNVAYRPGIMARALFQISGWMEKRRRQKAQRAARKAARS